MSNSIDNVPNWVRVAVGVLALFNIVFGIKGYVDVHILLHEGTGIDFSNPFIKQANYEFAARNLAIGLAMAFVTKIKGAPEALVILTIVRALIEIQSIIITFVQGNINAMLLVPIAFLLFEIFIIKALVGVISKEEKLKS